jgi:uncharacterized repeat protein (TIGR03803 family)
MTKLEIRGPLISQPKPDKKRSCLKMLSPPAIICMLSMCCLAAVIAAPAQDVYYATVVTFTFWGNGAWPYAGLVRGIDGNLYGTTSQGGIGFGTVYNITATGTLTTLYNFCSQPNCTDGEVPVDGLVLASDGSFYGTTEGNGYGTGGGTIFKITPSGDLTTLYTFCSAGPPCADGLYPKAGLVQGTDGNFYGTTYQGGGGDGCGFGCGTVFKITPAGVLRTLHDFCPGGPPCADGVFPLAGLVQGTDGNFYGTTQQGGVYDNCSGTTCGTIFRITPDGVLTVLHSFNGSNGAYPMASLIQASDGNFYGTTGNGGAYGGGTAFRIAATGTLTTLYSFCAQSGCTDGEFPAGSLLQTKDGSFYGTTGVGGEYDCGTAFRITLDGALTTLYSFCSQQNDGEIPLAGLVQATDGFFYGTTYRGGASNYGTIFRLLPVQACATCRP